MLGKVGAGSGAGNFIGAEDRVEFMTFLQAKPPEPTRLKAVSLPASAAAP